MTESIKRYLNKLGGQAVQERRASEIQSDIEQAQSMLESFGDGKSSDNLIQLIKDIGQKINIYHTTEQILKGKLDNYSKHSNKQG